MNQTDKLKKLISRCKCGVFVSINEHRNYYESVKEYMSDFEDRHDVDPDVMKIMMETNTIIDLHYYPNTPVGFTKIYHYDIDMALDEALED